MKISSEFYIRIDKFFNYNLSIYYSDIFFKNCLYIYSLFYSLSSFNILSILILF